MTRPQAYKRLAVIALAFWALVSLAGGGVVTATVLAAAVLATGALAVELGVGRSRRRAAEEPRE